MPENWNKLVTIQEAVAAYAAGDDLDAHCFLYAGDRVKPYRETISGDIVTLPTYDPPLTLYTETDRFVDSLIADIVPVQSGTGDPSPDNVRPISGWTGINVSRTGINIWDEEWEVGSINAQGQPQSVSNTIRSKNFCGIVGGKSYYIYSQKIDGGSQNQYYVKICFYDAEQNFISDSWSNRLVITAPSNAKYFKICTNSSTVVYGNTYNNDISINYPSTDRDYHPYQGNTYTVNWETEAGTVYGGTLDVTTGVLTVDRAKIVFDGSQRVGLSNWRPFEGTSAWLYSKTLVPNIKKPTDPAINILCDVLKPIPYGGAYGGIYNNHVGIAIVENGIMWSFAMRVPVVNLTTQSAINAWLSENPITVIYELAEPQTYQLTPREVTLLEGENKIFADTGSITLTYVETREEI